MSTNILRAKTNTLFTYPDLTDAQRQNAKANAQEMREERAVLKSFPQRLVLELTNACNLSCLMCGRNARSFRPTFFKLEWLERLAPVLDRVTEVTLFGWGEPTVHPQFRQVLEYLGRFPVKKYFLTNGMRLHQFVDLVIDNVDVMAVSLDGARAGTNDRIRRGADFERIVRNLQAVVEKRDSSARRKPHINFVMTLMKDNLHELPLLAELAFQLGIEEVKAVYLTAFSDDMAPQALWRQSEKIRAVFEETSELSKRYGIMLKLPYIQGSDPAGEGLHRSCHVGWRDFFLGSDGWVRPCQSSSQKFFSMDAREDFRSWWNSREYREFRKTVNHPELMPKPCRFCYQSSHANWNRRSSFLQNEVINEFAPAWGAERTAAYPSTGSRTPVPDRADPIPTAL